MQRTERHPPLRHISAFSYTRRPDVLQWCQKLEETRPEETHTHTHTRFMLKISFIKVQSALVNHRILQTLFSHQIITLILNLSDELLQLLKQPRLITQVKSPQTLCGRISFLTVNTLLIQTCHTCSSMSPTRATQLQNKHWIKLQNVHCALNILWNASFKSYLIIQIPFLFHVWRKANIVNWAAQNHCRLNGWKTGKCNVRNNWPVIELMTHNVCAGFFSHSKC